MISVRILFSLFLIYSIADCLKITNKHGFSCSIQKTMAPPFVKPPQFVAVNPPPYNFYILDSDGESVKNYSQQIYTIKLTADGKNYFRQFLIQARPAFDNGIVATNVRTGEFLLDSAAWKRQGLEILQCPSVLNDSITNSNEEKKQQIEFQWIIKRNEGPVQFLITIVQENDNYWVQWAPKSGLIFPDSQAKFTGFIAPTVAKKNLSKIESTNQVRFLSSASVNQIENVHSPGSKSNSKEILFHLNKVQHSTKNAGNRISTSKVTDDEFHLSTVKGDAVSLISESQETTELTTTVETTLEIITSTEKSSTVFDVTEIPETTHSDYEESSTISETTTKSFPEEENVTKIEKQKDIQNQSSDNVISNKTNEFSILNETTKQINSTEYFETTYTLVADKNNSVSELFTANNGNATINAEGVANITGSNVSHLFEAELETNITRTTIIQGSSKGKSTAHTTTKLIGNFSLSTTTTTTTSRTTTTVSHSKEKEKTDKMVCPSNFCKNYGTCFFDSFNKTVCNCPEGFNGTHCEIEVYDCKSSPCLNNGTCVKAGLSSKCQCIDGYMGQKCQRPCQDMYLSCAFWKDEGKCEDTRKMTKFYDVNCAVSCGQCVFDNATIRTVNPLPPALEPFHDLLGTWAANFSQPLRYPIDFSEAPLGYYEEISFFVTTLPVFGTPSLNYTAVAVNIADPNDAKSYVGFVTLKPNTEPTNVSIISTGNDGITIIEEGYLHGHNMNLTAQIFYVFPAIATKSPKELQRKIKFNGNVLEEEIERTDSSGHTDSFKKTYTKLSPYIAY